MSDYGRMEIMRMSDEEIKEILKKEGELLPDDTLVLMVEELKRRAETPDMPAEEMPEDLEEELSEEPEETIEEEAEEEQESDLSDEEKLTRLEQEIDRSNRENRKILIAACVAAAVITAAAVAVLIILQAIGKL